MDDNMEAEYNNYWETTRFYEDLESWGLDEAFPSYYYDSSSPEGSAAASSSTPSPAEKSNIVMERNRRWKLNERLYALRSVVPIITKMDKVSIVKDAIDYIQKLQEEERRLAAEVAELEGPKGENRSSGTSEEVTVQVKDQVVDKRNKKRSRVLDPASLPGKPPIEVMELKVAAVGEKTLLISITCNKRSYTLTRVGEIFESLHLKFMTASITSVCGNLLHTLFIESDQMNDEQLKEKIETAIAEYNSMASCAGSISFE